MFGLEALLAPLLPYILGGLALLAAFFGIRWSGKRDARKEAELDTLRATRDAQVKVGEAVGKDAGLDEAARAKVEEAKKAPTGGAKPGGTYEL